MWPEPLLASGFNRGKTAPGGGRGSRSPEYPLLSRTLLVLIAPHFVRAFLQVGFQVRSIREMKQPALTCTRVS